MHVYSSRFVNITNCIIKFIALAAFQVAILRDGRMQMENQELLEIIKRSQVENYFLSNILTRYARNHETAHVQPPQNVLLDNVRCNAEQIPRISEHQHTQQKNLII